MPMSPRLTSSSDQRAGLPARGDRALEHGDAGRAVASKNADCGLTTAAVSANAATQVSAKRASPSTSSGSPQASSSAGCGSMPTQSEPRSSRAASSRAPNVIPAACVAARRALGPVEVREADRVGERARSRARRAPARVRRGRGPAPTGRRRPPSRPRRPTRRRARTAARPARCGCRPCRGSAGGASAARTCHTQRTATGRIAGPDRPPVTPPSAGAIVSVSMTMPSRVLISENPSAPASAQARAMCTMSVTSGDSLANTGCAGSAARRTAPMTRERRDRVAREDLAAALDIRAGDVDLERRHRRVAGSLRAGVDELVGVPAGDRDDGPRAVLGQPGQVVRDERVDPRALQPDRVEHAAGRLGHPRGRATRPRRRHDRLGDHGTELRDVEELRSAAHCWRRRLPSAR